MNDQSREGGLAGSGRHFLWTFLPQFLTVIANLWLLGYTIRVLGLAGYGVLSLLGIIGLILNTAASALSMATVRASARDRGVDPANDRVAELRATQWLFRWLALLSLSAGIIVAVSTWALDIGGGEDPFVVAGTLALLGASTAVGFVSMTANGILASHRRFALLGQIAVVTLFLRVSLTLLLLPRFGLLGAGLVGVSCAVATAVPTIWAAAHREPELHWWRVRRPNRMRLREVGRYASGLALLNASYSLIQASDGYVIAAILNPAAVGRYRLGATPANTISGMLFAGYGVVFQALARASSLKAALPEVRLLTRIMSWLAGAAFGALAIAGNEVVKAFIGHYDSSAYHVLLAFSAGLAVETCLHGMVLAMLAQGKQSAFVRWTPVEIVANLGLTIVLSIHFGLTGTAIASVATYVLMDIVLMPLVFRGHWPVPPTRFVLWNGLLRCVAAAGCTLGLTSALVSLGLFGGSGMAVILCAGIAGLLTAPVGLLTLSREERSGFRKLFARERAIPLLGGGGQTLATNTTID